MKWSRKPKFYKVQLEEDKKAAGSKLKICEREPLNTRATRQTEAFLPHSNYKDSVNITSKSPAVSSRLWPQIKL